MVKLIRLVSDSNGVFKSSFGTDLTIKEQAKIALLNITFKTSIENLVVNSTTGSILTDTENPTGVGAGTGNIKPKQYNGSNIDELAADVEFGLNGTLALPLVPGVRNNTSSQYNVYLQDDKYIIVYRYSPFCNPLVENDTLGTEPLYPVELIVKGTPTIDSTNTTMDAQTITTIQKAVGAPSANDTFARYVCQEGYSFSKGSGLVTLRINDSVDNGSGVGVADNGGVLGLTDAQLTNDNTEVLGTDMRVQLIYNRPTENYFYSINGGTPIDTGILPSRVSLNVEPDDLLHDIMWIQRQQNYIAFGVWQMVGGYLHLPSGNQWTLANPAPVGQENWDEIDLGDIATYRRMQVGVNVPTWWEATPGYNWNVYQSNAGGPPVAGDAVNYTCSSNLETGVLTISSGPNAGNTFTPAQMPTMAGTTVATETRFEDFLAVQGSVYRPFMTVRGASTNVKFDLFNFSVNPYFGVAGPNNENERWQMTNVGGESALDNGYRDILSAPAGTLVDVVTIIDDDSDPDRWEETYKNLIILHNSIWAGLGFSQAGKATAAFSGLQGIIGPNTDVENTSVIEAESIPSFLLSDNFMVVSDTLKLDSFDASDFQYGKFAPNSRVSGDMAGRRQNILMTIPVNDNENGVVEYQTNTPIFININNAVAQNLKNLNFRVLNKDFQELNLNSENAIMTILIED